MSQNVTVNGTVYAFPTNLETNWGTVVTNWAAAVSSSTLQKSGGTFTLTAEADFGATYGLKSAYFKSRTSNISSTGVVRLANADTVAWRNAANSSDLPLGVNGSNQLVYNGTVVISGTSSLTASRAVVTDGSGVQTTATTTSTEIGYVNGVTSSIQTQLNAKEPTITTLSKAKGGSGQDNSSLTFPASGTLATLAGSETLTNKTLNGNILNTFISNGVTFTNPTADGSSGQVIKTNGSGALSFISALSNPMTTGGDIIYGGASGVATRLANGSSGQYLKSTGGTSAPGWQSFSIPTVQKFTTGSGTYTTPANCLYIRVRMVGGGGGGGGAGAGATAGNASTASTASTFGTTLLSAGAGGGGAANAGGIGGTGGTSSLGTGPVGLALTGGQGAGGVNAISGAAIPGGIGAASAFGGGGSSFTSVVGTAGATNTGGGGGGGSPNANNITGGAGGGSGGFVDAIITSPSATYSYVVGVGGSGGAAGTSGTAGGAGGSGIIIVEEFYQ